jgi:CheY-like chemotaxis protein
MPYKKKVLVVEDSKTALLAVLGVVEQLPCEVLTAANGAEAVQSARVHRPDVIVMDVLMPKMTGLEACQMLRSHAETRDVPIILLTTLREVDKVKAGFASGASDYLFKPVDGPALLAKLKGYLGL